ncbi:MAG: hypothetical protein ACJAYY_000303 [Paraglaciecola sp.]|jgi:hypothetical protein
MNRYLKVALSYGLIRLMQKQEQQKKEGLSPQVQNTQ